MYVWVVFEDCVDEGFVEGVGCVGDEDGFIVEYGEDVLVLCWVVVDGEGVSLLVVFF